VIGLCDWAIRQVCEHKKMMVHEWTSEVDKITHVEIRCAKCDKTIVSEEGIKQVRRLLVFLSIEPEGK
jgi:hypothetical protein